MTMPDFEKLEKTLGVVFKNKDLLKEALTHRSYINENPSWKLPHNERLEFLGDAVLELVVTEHLYALFPDKPEGELTNLRAALVRADTLGGIARELEVNDFLLLSRGEAKDTGRARDVILANALEALIGAIYLDRGMKQIVSFIERAVLRKLSSILEVQGVRDPKSCFQEAAQEKLGITPFYRVLSEWGPDHAKLFRLGVYLGEELVAEGEGHSKQVAEQKAAEQALIKKGW